jgi:V/A-type H+-transporting ATPase subunit I
MTKVEVIGPREQFLKALGVIRRSETLQIDPDIQRRIEIGAETRLKPLALDGKTIGVRLFYEDAELKIARLLELLPKVPAKVTPLDPAAALNSMAEAAGAQIALCEEKTRRREALGKEMEQLNRYAVFLTTVESLAPKGAEEAGLDVIAVEVRDEAALQHLIKAAGRLLLGSEVRTARSEDGSYIGLLTTEKQLSETLKETLRNDQIPEVSLPPWLENLPLPEKLKAVRARYDELAAESAAIEVELGVLAREWRGACEQVHEWLQSQLALLKTTTLAYGTEACFVLFGWMPSAKVHALRGALDEEFGGTVLVEEKEILEKDLESIPVALKNPAYFEPFELLVRLLPLPRYTSIDPTPFIGIFFPLFFGMILGDIGYGLILLLGALLLTFSAKSKLLSQAGRILSISSLYSIVFGFLYGEFFGAFLTEVLGVRAGWIDRRTSLMPMLYFAVAVGGIHVLVGLVLGALTALKGKRAKEAGFRLASVVLVLCIAGLLASYFAPVAELLRRPMIIAMLIIAPVLLLTGGLLAPFELLKSLGNIFSYARIMAVGLASVLLAYVANSLAGAAGSLWVGIAVAVLLHAFNLVLGVFAPTIHALRLHYVEFFGKFFEPGGKPYLPLKEV